MATYVPGVESYRPVYTPYQPDFEFANMVMSTRQDRYDTNYKAMSDLYGSVVYADLSRKDTQEQRDDFAKRLVPQIQQISGMDLSLYQNMDAAQGVFKPFVENKLIQQDVYRTSKYKNELQRAKSLLDSNNPEITSQYSDLHVQALNYQLQDFIDAAPEEAMRMPIPEYVPAVNLYDMALNYLKDSGIEAKDFTFTKDNRFIIKQKNGDLVFDAAYDRALRHLSKDPRVQKAYATDSYVKARMYADEGVQSGKFATLNEGRMEWAKSIISDINTKAAVLEAKQKGNLKEADAIVKRHEEVVNSKGEESLTPAEKEAWEIALEDKTTSEEKLKRTQETLQSGAGKLSEDQQATLNKAYGMLMNWNMGDDLKAAAKSYSMQGAERDIEINGYQRDIDKHNLDMIKQNAQNNWQAEQNRLNRENDIKAAKIAGGVDDDLVGALAGLNAELTVDYVKDKDGKPDPNANIIDMSRDAFKEQFDKIDSQEVEAILKFHQAKEGSTGTPGKIEIQTEAGVKVLSIDQARKELNKPENKKYAQVEFNKIADALKSETNFRKQYPNISPALQNQFKQQVNEITGLATRVERSRQEMEKTAAKNFDQVLSFTNLDDVPEVNKDIKNNVPKIVQNNKVLTEKEFVDQVIASAKSGKTKELGWVWDSKFEKTVTKYDTSRGMTARTASGMDYPKITVTEFDTEAATEYAKEAYERQKMVLNRTMNGFYNDQGGTEKQNSETFKTFSPHYLLRGGSPDDMTGDTAFLSNAYGTGMIVPGATGNMSPERKAILLDAINQIKAGGVTFVAGKAHEYEKDDITAEESAATQEIIKQALNDLSAGVQGSNDKKKGIFSITYQDTYGLKDDKKSGAYIITFDGDYLNKFVAGSSEDAGSEILSKTQKTKFNTVTMLVNPEQDRSSYAGSNFNYSQVDTDIQFNDSYSRDIINGGQFYIYKDQGVYMLGGTTQVFDPESKTYKKSVPNELIQIRYPDLPEYGELRGELVKGNDIQRFADYIENNMNANSEKLTQQINEYTQRLNKKN
jgi:hypothetical protein